MYYFSMKLLWAPNVIQYINLVRIELRYLRPGMKIPFDSDRFDGIHAEQPTSPDFFLPLFDQLESMSLQYPPWN